jgi:hypothetical protein
MSKYYRNNYSKSENACMLGFGPTRNFIVQQAAQASAELHMLSPDHRSCSRHCIRTFLGPVCIDYKRCCSAISLLRLPLSDLVPAAAVSAALFALPQTCSGAWLVFNF